MQLGLDESSGMFLSHVGLKKALRAKSCRRMAGRCAIPFWGHLLLLHVPNPVLKVVKDGLWSLATFKHAYVGLQISRHMLADPNISGR
jgi:hypothetical protein